IILLRLRTYRMIAPEAYSYGMDLMSQFPWSGYTQADFMFSLPDLPVEGGEAALEEIHTLSKEAVEEELEGYLKEEYESPEEPSDASAESQAEVPEAAIESQVEEEEA